MKKHLWSWLAESFIVSIIYIIPDCVQKLHHLYNYITVTTLEFTIGHINTLAIIKVSYCFFVFAHRQSTEM